MSLAAPIITAPGGMVVARTAAEIEAVLPQWNRLLLQQSYPAVDSDPRRYLAVLRAFHREPYLAYAPTAEGGNLLLGFHSCTPLRCRFGYQTIFKAPVRCLNLEYGGILGQIRPGSFFLDRIFQKLRDEVDLVVFNHLRLDSEILPALREVRSWRREAFLTTQPHWRIAAPESMDAFFQSCTGNHRSNLRRLVKRLEKDYAGKLELACYRSPSEVDQAVTDAASISGHTYQAALGAGLEDSLGTRTLLKAAAAEGWFRGYLLYLEGAPAAFHFALKYGRCLFGDQIGFEPRFREYGVGTYVFLKVLEDLCRTREADYYDFGFGDAEYKRRYGTESWEEACVYFFSPRLYPLTLNFCRNAVTGTRFAAQWLLRRTGLESTLKRRWRNRLAQVAK